MLETLGFFIGVQLTINLFASCYRIIDLWYCIAEYRFSILAKISFNLLIILACYLIGNEGFIFGLIVGQIFFSLYHICIFWLGQLLVIILR